MNNFLNLVMNENMKIYRKLSTWVMIGILIVVMIIASLLTDYMANDNSDSGRSDLAWKQQVEFNKNNMEASIEKGNLPNEMKRMYEKEIAISNYRLENNVAPIQTKSIGNVLQLSTNLVSLITLFTVIVAAGSVASEFSNGTIKLLLIRPVNRSKILLSKFISSLIFAMSMLVILFGTSILIGLVMYGFDGVNQTYLSYEMGKVIETNIFAHTIILYVYHVVELIMMATFAFMISTVFRNNSLAIGLTIFLMFTGTQFVMLLSKYSWVKYILFANTNLMQYVDGIPIIKGMTMSFSILVLIAYFILFNSVSWLIFNKRDVAA